MTIYGCLAVAALLPVGLMLSSRRRWHPWLSALRFAVLGFGAAQWRAVGYQSSALDAKLNGAELELQGVIIAMPQSGELGQHFLFEIESARQHGAPAQVLPCALLSWYRRDGHRQQR